ncbi:MAG: signal peptidase II [Actinomycetota bacterium]|nr:signal peptidase II [Actinomycetota bacterium]MDK1103388.1 signal peptidase II [Actinomycetota bacterium]
MPDMTTNPTTTDPTERGRGRVFPTRLPSIDTCCVLAIAVSVVFAVDQITKEFAIHALASGPITLGGLHLHLVANRGAALAFTAPTSIVVLATVGVVIVALRSARGSRITAAFAYGLLAGGALGNLADRFQVRHFHPRPSSTGSRSVASRSTLRTCSSSSA